MVTVRKMSPQEVKNEIVGLLEANPQQSFEPVTFINSYREELGLVQPEPRFGDMWCREEYQVIAAIY